MSRHYEIGATFLLGADALLNLALFQIDTDDELTVATNGGGRATYRNAPASRRRGVELLLEAPLGRGFAGSLAATYLDSEFTESFSTCAGIPCRTVAPTLNLTTVEADISAVSVNDANGRFYAPGPGTGFLIGLTASYRF